MSEAVLFKTCLGYTDSLAVGSQKADPRSGKTQLIGCSNLTVTDDGGLRKIPASTAVFTHTAPITRVSAGSRLFAGDGTDIYELTSGTPVLRFPILDGPIMHTPLDVRVSGTTKVYKSVNPTGAMAEAVVGTNPGPDDSIAYAGQPLFDGGFVLGARAYCHKGKFLSYSKGYHYDLWNLGDGFIRHQYDCLQSGAIPGCIVVAHAEGISVYVGGDPLSPEIIKRFYPCGYLAKTLFSGFISKALGYGHVFMADDGVYMVAADGSFNRLSGDSLEYGDLLNGSYAGATVAGGKYLAYGNLLTVEYDFRTKAVLLRGAGVSSACVFSDEPYTGVGNTVVKPSTTMDTALPCSFALPYSHLGAEGRKGFDSLYLTGEFNGDMEVICRDQTDPEVPDRWMLAVSELGRVQNKRVKLPRVVVGSRVSFEFKMDSGSISVEEIRATFSVGQRR